MPTVQDLQAKVGEVVGTSDWIQIDQPRIQAFADATDDHQFIHVDPERAKMTPFGGTIAHGFLTLSMLTALAERLPDSRIEGVKMGINYGFDKVRFLTPVPAGVRIRGTFKLLSLEEKRPGQWQQTQEVTVEIEDQKKPALIAEWIAQFFI
ncbi:MULTISPECIES: MaoC family dehydratase [Sphingomonas]|uniref:Acyl dehydratase n=2 Tax=Sphingomonas TaxID=13687 RepID=A0A7W9BUX4_9SPHN|nr:MaoC family dehydratase [Sphingomonas prati]MBB5730133.1 acyl dehydratase [Sphingomonas prati]GGE91735.1 nodulation protein NodN [Sphingomonas prati]